MCGFFACKFILTQCKSIVSKRREGCKGRERGTQTAEMAQIKFIAAVMPLEVLQRHSNGRNATNQVYCRCSAPGGAPAALKRQKPNKSSLLPPKCPWRASSVTQAAETKQIKLIAAVVPLEVLQRHSNGRNVSIQAYCRRSAPGGPPAALKRQKTNKSSKLPLKCPWTTSSGTQTAANPQIIPKPPNRLNNYKKRYLASLCDACSFPVCRQ